jgi:hypothetical protein
VDETWPDEPAVDAEVEADAVTDVDEADDGGSGQTSSWAPPPPFFTTALPPPGPRGARRRWRS